MPKLFGMESKGTMHEGTSYGKEDKVEAVSDDEQAEVVPKSMKDSNHKR